MSKKKTGLLVVLGAALGAAAAGISYYLKYKSFNDELDKDFHDYEDGEPSPEEESSPKPASQTAGERTYITLDPGKCRSCEEKKDEAAGAAAVFEAETGETKAQKTSEETVPESASESATVEEDTDGAGK